MAKVLADCLRVRSVYVIGELAAMNSEGSKASTFLYHTTTALRPMQAKMENQRLHHQDHEGRE